MHIYISISIADREATKKSDAADYFVRKVLPLHGTLVWGIHTSKFLTVRATTDLSAYGKPKETTAGHTRRPERSTGANKL